MKRIVKTALSVAANNQGEKSARPPDFIFERSDVAAFRSLDALCMKAGVSRLEIAKLVAKELADNGLDQAEHVAIRKKDREIIVTDDGPGIEVARVAELFSVARRPQSSKYLRGPTRGAVGNGLRVVVGAVLASRGSLVVCTRGHRLELQPQAHDGSTVVLSDTPWIGKGTEVTVSLGHEIPLNDDVLAWAGPAIAIGNLGKTYRGKSSPFWYDAEAFFELLNAAGELPVRSLIAMLDGCSGSRRSGGIVESFQRRSCASITRDEAASLLHRCREAARPVKAKRLGAVGPRPEFRGYAVADGTFKHGDDQPAEIPFRIEVWAKVMPGRYYSPSPIFYLNRTPATGSVGIEIAKYEKEKRLTVQTAAEDYISRAAPLRSYQYEINICAPFIAHTSEGKHADLSAMGEVIAEAAAKATRRAYMPEPRVPKVHSSHVDYDPPEPERPPSVKAEFLAMLPEAIAFTSSDGAFRFRQRQLFYTLRRMIQESGEADRELQWSYFCSLVTEYEAKHGEIPDMLRDPRGTLILPHDGGSMPLGTETVEQFKRPDWLFNKVLFVEKEGIADILRDNGWDNRHDCALIGSKGFSTRAIRDLIDDLADTDEPVKVFALHDADAYGSMIFQTLQDETLAREARKIDIINIGLEPWQATQMSLIEETFPAGRNERAVARYVTDRADGKHWREWLQTHRIELNALRPEELIAFIDKAMEPYVGKLIPPDEVTRPKLIAAVRINIHTRVGDKVLPEIQAKIEKLEAKATHLRRERAKAIDTMVSRELATLRLPNPKKFVEAIDRVFKERTSIAWDTAVCEVARMITEKEGTTRSRKRGRGSR